MLKEDEIVTSHLSEDTIDHLMDFEKYIGFCEKLAMRVYENSRKKREQDVDQ